MMEASSPDKPRSKREKSKQTQPFTSAILVAFVFAMIVAVAFRLGRHGNQGSCHFDASNQKASCKGKDLHSIPSDIPDSVVVLQMGDTLDHGENHFPVLHRGNFTRFRNLRELTLVRCDIESVSNEPFADLVDLRRLDLRFNRIRILSESSFRGLGNLEYLLLSNNPIQVLDDNVFRGLRIEHLDFANNPVLWKITPKAFFESSVVRLTFNRCNLKSVKSETWAPLASSLRRLQISDNLQPLDVKEDAFKGFHLEQIVLINDGITSTAFLKHGDYEQITLDRNPLESIKFWHNEDRHSKKKPQKITKHLSLSGAKISKVSQDIFSVFGNLEILNLSSNNIALVNAGVFEDLDHLRILDLSENDVVEFVGNFSKVLPQLETLLLNGNEVQTIPVSMEPFFSRLFNISLGGNPFHCNCELRWLVHWLEENSGKHQETANASPIACRSPETKNFSQISEYDLRCRAPTILNATIDKDGMTLVCTADGDPAPAVTWLGPFGEESTVEPSTAKRDIFQTNGRMTMVKDGNYTCKAVNTIAMDSVVVDTNSIPLNGVKFFNENQQRLRILESPQGLLVTAALLGILGYILRHQ